MCTQIVLKEVLTGDMIRLGADLTEELERGGWPVAASFWLYDAEINQWKVVVASPTVDDTGPLAGYGRVLAALDAIDGMLPWGGLSVVAPRDAIVRALCSSAYARGENIEGRRISGMINRELIDDAYLYRLTPAVTP